MRRPTTGSRTITLPNGCHKKVDLYTFAVILTEINGDRVKAVRVDEQSSEVTAAKKALLESPGWKLKAVCKLTDGDFDERVK